MMGQPPVAPAANNNNILYVVLAAAALFGLYYVHNQGQNPGTAPAPQTQPGNPAQQPANPGQQPENPAQQPENPGKKQGVQWNQNQAILQVQQFTGSYNAVNGYIQVSQGQWHNGSNIALAAARLQCTQKSAAGQALTQIQTTLVGPAQPEQTVAVPAFMLGAEAQGAQKVDCAFLAVVTEN
jgi:hypothetical protein